MKDYLEIFLAFLKMGLITFGGGYAIIPIVDRELIRKRGWVTMDEVMDYYTIAQITPGIIAVNFSTFVGHKRKGALGGLLATVGFVLPGVTFILAAAIFISNLAGIPEVQHIFTGIRLAVAALILDTVIKMVKGVFKDKKALAIYIIVFALAALPAGILPPFVKSPVTLVLTAGIVGLFIYRQKKPAAAAPAANDAKTNSVSPADDANAVNSAVPADNASAVKDANAMNDANGAEEKRQ